MSEGRETFGEGAVVMTHGRETVAPSPLAGRTNTGARAGCERKIAILGFGKSVRECPWQDYGWELWAMNGFWRAAEKDFGIAAPESRYTAWFDMHSAEYTKAYGIAAGFGDAQDKWLREVHPFPVFMLSANHEYPSSVSFPIESIVTELGADYFTSTVAYMLATALYQSGVSEVGLFGIDLIHDTEYGSQRPCAEYWVGRLQSAGIKVTLSEGSAICKQVQRYGYEPDNPLVRDMLTSMRKKRDAFRDAVERGNKEVQERTNQMRTDDGAYQMCQGVIDYLEAYSRGGKLG